MKYDYDLFVIGAGSGGVRAARMSANLGAKVAIAEERYLGGTCVNVGCIPKKLFVYGSHFSEDFEESAAYGWQIGDTDFEWSTLLENKDREISRLNGIYKNLLESPGAAIYETHAELVDAHSIRVGDHQVTSDKILVATGSWPSIPAFPGNEHVQTSNDAFFFETLPERVIVVGGGYIAVEFAGIYQGLGVDTTLLYRGPLFLRGFDDSVREFVRDQLIEKGVDVRFDAVVDEVVVTNEGKVAHLTDGTDVVADEILYATGRRPLSSSCGLESVGVRVDRSSAIRVDSNYQTNVPNIYAIGDVIDRMQLTPVAIAEGMCIAYNLFGGESRQVTYEDIPTSVFCQPNIGTVGPTETVAQRTYDDLHVYESSFRPLKLTMSDNQERTYMKLLVDGDTDRVVAAHMVGPEAGEIIQGLAVAIKAGATKADFDATIGIHPTAAEEFVTMRERSR
ncbi:MAG: glutathione-disulfide reductase [Gammaproteobacteria bacterium]|nr:glutathione-disulfide reductase [Gammaproteobacteria bacterium]